MVSSWKREVIKNFDRHAETYDLYCGIQETIAQNLAYDLPDLDCPDVLEIGAGTGTLTSHLLRKYKGGRFEITDISPGMIALARDRLKQENVFFSVLDGENIKLSKSFDLIAANMAFQWFEDIEGGIFQLRKYLKPGGVLYFTIPGPFCFQKWKTVLKKLLLPSGMYDFKKPSGVFREEYRTFKYPNTSSFLKVLKKTGACTPVPGYRPLESRQIIHSCRLFDETFNGHITWHILYGYLCAE
ncbi:MAG: methyltransferase [Micavibrio sp.]|nr:methyltransferase [Micavibrio sp.]